MMMMMIKEKEAINLRVRASGREGERTWEDLEGRVK